MKPSIPVLILAAGSSSRMGQPKQLLPVGETTLLGTVIETAQHGKLGPVYCILGKYEALIRPAIAQYATPIIFNPHWKTGLSSSIRTGIRHLEKEHPDAPACLILLGDQPLVPAIYLQSMVDRWQADQEKIIASDYGKKVGVPALFPHDRWDKLEQLQGDHGAGKFLNTHTEEVISLPAAAYLFDIDSPDDYARLPGL